MKLPREIRRFTIFLHVLVSVSWIGVDLVIGVLSFTGLTTDDPQTMATAYTAISMFGVPLLLTLGLLALATGLTLGWGTRFGLVRHWWVVTKLIISLVLITLVVVALRPTLIDAAAESAVVDPTLPERLDQVRLNMIFPPLVSTAALLFATWLGVYKPWGQTRFGRSHRAPAQPRSVLDQAQVRR